MAFPDDIFEQRELENVPGQTFDAGKKKRLYAEDVQGIGDRLAALETWIAANVGGWGGGSSGLDWRVKFMYIDGGGDVEPIPGVVVYNIHAEPYVCNFLLPALTADYNQPLIIKNSDAGAAQIHVLTNGADVFDFSGGSDITLDVGAMVMLFPSYNDEGPRWVTTAILSM